MLWLAPGGRPPTGARAYFAFLQKAITRDMCNVATVAPNPDEYDDNLWNEIYDALESLRQSIDDTITKPIIFWGHNSVALHASKCALFLTKVRESFPKSRPSIDVSSIRSISLCFPQWWRRVL
jgi:hypothetical protein